MKRILALVLFTLFPLVSQASDRQADQHLGTSVSTGESWAIGLTLGAPVGAVVQAPVVDRWVVRVGGGQRSGLDQRVFAYTDGVYRMPDLIKLGGVTIPFEIGLGVSHQPTHENWAASTAVRIPFGFYYQLKSIPADLMLAFAQNIFQTQKDGVESQDGLISLLYKF